MIRAIGIQQPQLRGLITLESVRITVFGARAVLGFV